MLTKQGMIGGAGLGSAYGYKKALE
jgi:hypothetical protein